MKRATLYQKLIFYFFIVILLSLTSVGIFSYTITSRELDAVTENQMSQIVGNSVHHTDLYLKSYERAMTSMLSNVNVKRFLDTRVYRTQYEYYEFRELINDETVGQMFISNPEIAAVYVIGFNGNALYYYNNIVGEDFEQDGVERQLDYFREHTSKEGSLSILNHSVLSGQENKMLTLVRQIRGLSSTRMEGFIGIEFRSADLSALWKGIDLGKEGYFFIMDEEGTIVYDSNQNRVGSSISPALARKIDTAGDSKFEYKAGGVNRIYMVREAEYPNWKLVVSQSRSVLRKPIDDIRLTTIVVGLFTMAIGLWLAYRFGKSITGPIQVLKNGMRQTEKGNWAMIPLPDHRDEIVELMIRYNLMVNRLSELVDQVYLAELEKQESELERQKAEFQSLQLQINPHFLYNTLETIVCYAAIQDSEEIAEIVQSMAYMLRYSVQTNIEETKVVNELKHVLYYMVILRHRIGREFEIDVAMKSEYLLDRMVRLTLQPLVENVFQHAFRDGVEDDHRIRIDAGKKEGVFWVSVEDNGAGMDEFKLAELRRKLDGNQLADRIDHAGGPKGGIGILNVHRRIQLAFGKQYGLRIESKPEQGTRIVMIMPAMEPFPEDERKEGISDAQMPFERFVG
ncbi:sensor histidine kinase [Cohnella zeiphila]|uniref:Histidine kinase n=1 Tax=Cohnella zeiphila TaxID=2761120 RepID=A0A7X0SGB4_9BACL|nr:sensor histidine kinase [Cohnella zeiphila]MBB6729447.1 histidine kinase [Cohnella zeiphila]